MPKKNTIQTPKVFYDSNHPNFINGQSDCDCNCDCNCDCACSLPTSNIDNNAPSLNKKFTLSFLSTNFSTLNLDETYSICFGGSCKTTVVNQETLSILREFQNPALSNFTYADMAVLYGEDAADTTLKKLIETGLITISKENKSLKDIKSNTLAAWLHVTDRCNLRCSYCYLPHQPNDMKLETGITVIKSIFQSAQIHGYSQVKIKYGGGEPLLHFNEILAWHSYACKLGEDHHINLDGIILTNGTLLTPDIADDIQKAGLHLMVSLDGLGTGHDVHRSYVDGHGSFKQVSDAIGVAIKKGITPNISVTISGKNAKKLPELVSWIREQNLPFALNFARENSYSKNRLTENDEQEIITGMLNTFKIIEKNMPEHSILSSLVDRANLAVPHLRTCSIEKNYLVFDYQGNIFRCQMDMTHPVAKLEVKNDPLSIITSYSNPINISVDLKEGCNECEWKYWCTGGCPLLTKRITGQSNVKSPYCNVYKTLYPEAFRLEGYRLLQKYQTYADTV